MPSCTVYYTVTDCEFYHDFASFFHTFSHLDGTLTIASGVTVEELMPFFKSNGICFPSNVILRDVTIAGIVSTGCHVS